MSFKRASTEVLFVCLGARICHGVIIFQYEQKEQSISEKVLATV